MFELTHLPIPPTSNRLLMPSNGRLIKTPEARRYEVDMQLYGIRNRHKIEQLKKILIPPLRVDCFFVFFKDRLISKKNTFKKLDASNRIKMIHDELSKLIGIDDSQFVGGIFEKLYCDSKYEEQIIVRFSNVKIRSIYELLEVKNEIKSTPAVLFP